MGPLTNKNYEMTRIVAGRTNDVSVCSITMCVQHLVVCHCGSAACLPANKAAVVYQLAERAKERIPFDSLLYAPKPKCSFTLTCNI